MEAKNNKKTREYIKAVKAGEKMLKRIKSNKMDKLTQQIIKDYGETFKALAEYDKM